MTRDMIQQYTTLVEFLGGVLGPDYEITLYDLEADGQPAIAIANGRISGQTVGSPLSHPAQELLHQREYEQRDYMLHFTSRLQDSGRAIRSSVLFIKGDSGEPVGLLGINFDDSRYLSLCGGILDLIHPQDFLRRNAPETVDVAQLLHLTASEREEDSGEAVYNDVSSMMQKIFAEAALSLQVPADRLTQEERIEFIALLRSRGMFRLKGGIQYTAEKLGCSQASIYRYLSKSKTSE